MFCIGTTTGSEVSIWLRVLFEASVNAENQQVSFRLQPTADGQWWNEIRECSAQKCDEHTKHLPISRSAGWWHDPYWQLRSVMAAFCSLATRPVGIQEEVRGKCRRVGPKKTGLKVEGLLKVLGIIARIANNPNEMTLLVGSRVIPKTSRSAPIRIAINPLL